MSAHEVSDRCKQLQFAWQHCAEVTGMLTKIWPEQATAVNW